VSGPGLLRPIQGQPYKALFGDQQVSHLGFTLTPQGIKRGEAKLKAIKLAKAPTDVKSNRSFVGLCNFFQNHIQKFEITAAPLFKSCGI
jgi:hypothetical protein